MSQSERVRHARPIQYDSRSNEKVLVTGDTYYVFYAIEGEEEKRKGCKRFILTKSLDRPFNERAVDVYPNGKVTELAITEVVIRLAKKSPGQYR